MIRIRRGQEPKELREERDWRLARALVEWARRPLVGGEHKPWTKSEREARFRDGYRGESSETLWRRQRFKCAYCERGSLGSREDIEHFRPVKLYWWLTWTWSNHFFVCGSCATSPKGARFPQQPGGHRLAVGELPPGDERPRWVDPGREDPTPHIGFRREDHGAKPKWEPVGLTTRGVETIAGLGLDSGGLPENYEAHIAALEHPDDLLARVRKRAREGQNARSHWQRVVNRAVLHPDASFRAFSRAYLTSVRDELQTQHGVELPMLPSLADSSPADPETSVFAPDTRLIGLTEAAALKIRAARGHRASSALSTAALLAALEPGPSSIAALADLFGKSPSTIRGWVRECSQVRLRRGIASRV